MSKDQWKDTADMTVEELTDHFKKRGLDEKFAREMAERLKSIPTNPGGGE